MIYQFSAFFFFSTITVGIIKLHFEHYVGKYSPEYPSIFCAGIGPLQLGVVLIIFLVLVVDTSDKCGMRTCVMNVDIFHL